jgi:ATP-binding cassette subfamily F protein 3
LELADGRLTEYSGNYSYYLMKKEAEREAEEEARLEAEEAAKKEAAKKAAAKPAAVQRDAEERAAAKERAEAGKIQSMSDAKRTEMIQRAEAEIAMAEAELKGLEFQMNQPAIQADPAESQRIAEEYAAKEAEIEERYAKWERLVASE